MIFPIFACVAALGLSATDEMPTPDPSRPLNVVLILADDLGWADLGCTGAGYYETPYLDRLAARGVRLTSAYAACPVCSPTRAALLTGRNPARIGLTDWLPGRGDRPGQKLLGPELPDRLPADVPTLAERLSEAGYRTASVGKWHLGGPGAGPLDRGFDRNVAGTERGSPPGYFPRADGTFDLPGLRDDPRPGRHLTDRLADEAVDFLEDCKDTPDRPFFLYLSFFAVHIPIQPEPGLRDYYLGKSPGDSPRRNPHYAALVGGMDRAAGRVLDALDAAGLVDQTLVIFTSDNGGLATDNGGLATKEGPHTPATSNAPLRAGKGYLYEGGIRVPLLIDGPGVIGEGTAIDAPATSVDLYATILDAAGLPTDAESDGSSLLGLLRGEPAPAARDFHWHYPHYANQGGRPGGAIRRGDLKLIESYEDGKVELHDLAVDLAEAHDLAADRPEQADELRRALHDWRESVGAKMPTPK